MKISIYENPDIKLGFIDESTTRFFIGIDPGIASMAITVLRHNGDDGSCELIETKLIETKPERRITKSAALKIRLFDIVSELEKTIRGNGRLFSQRWLGVEINMVSMTTATTYGFLLGAMGNLFLPHQIIEFHPTVIKRTMTGQHSATKENVQCEVINRLPEIKKAFAKLPARNHEHVADATAIALTLREKVIKEFI